MPCVWLKVSVVALAVMGLSLVPYVVHLWPGYLVAGGMAAFVATAVHSTVVLVIGGVLAVDGVGLWIA